MSYWVLAGKSGPPVAGQSFPDPGLALVWPLRELFELMPHHDALGKMKPEELGTELDPEHSVGLTVSTIYLDLGSRSLLRSPTPSCGL